mgnify:CR=1 FL=1
MAAASRRQITLRLMSIFLGVSASALVIFTSIPEDSILNIFERKIYDAWQRHRGNLAERDDILILGITSNDLQVLGRWPWPRWVWSRVLEELNRFEPAAIVFDIVITEQEKGLYEDLTEEQIAQNPALRRIVQDQERSQQQFVDSVRQAGNVFLVGYLDLARPPVSTSQTLQVLNRTESLPSFGPNNFQTPASASPGEFRHIVYRLPEGSDYVLPFAEVVEAAAGIGFINAEPDSDGITRKTQLLARIGDRIFPSLDLIVISNFLGVPIRDFRIIPGEEIIIPHPGREYRIPVNKDGQGYINFKGQAAYLRPDSRGTSVSVFLNAARFGGVSYAPETIRGKIVVIGMLAEGSTDIRAVPVDKYYPLVGVHATVLDNILSQSHVRVMPAWRRVGFLLLTGLVYGLAFPRLRPIGAGVLALAALVGTPAAAYSIFRYHSYWVPTLQPALAVGLGFSFITLYYFITEQVQRRHIQEVFGRCVDRTVVKQIAESGLDPQLGGTRRHITVMFADIRGFTPYSEQHEAEAVVGRLNEYFTAMSEVIFRHRGTIDKYMGDAIMVFYGEPVPMEDHALKAVRTAIAMQAAMRRLQERWGEAGFSQGIGIHTGEVIVGWMGSPSKKEYTVIGDTVNTAFRLEGVAKAGQVLISEATCRALGGAVELRPLEPVRLKGKREPLQIYEVPAAPEQSGP